MISIEITGIGSEKIGDVKKTGLLSRITLEITIGHGLKLQTVFADSCNRCPYDGNLEVLS